MELYRVTSTVDKFPHDHHRFNQVTVHWFVADRKMPVVQYKNVIKDYSLLPGKDQIFTREFIKEMFTLKEVELLKSYLETVHGWTVNIEQAQLPVEGRWLGFRAHQIGGVSGFHKLNTEQSYNLSLKVWGYYNVDALEQISGLGDIFMRMKDVITRTRERFSALVNRHFSKENKVV